MNQRKQLLMPVQVPWQISPSVPYLRLQVLGASAQATATFIGFYKSAARTHGQVGVSAIQDPGEFHLSDSAEGARHRLTRVLFEGVAHSRQLPAVSDAEVIAEDAFDWSLVPTGIQAGETAEDAVRRVNDLWLSKGYCPDPAMYEVQSSDWLGSLGLDDAWHHYILLGHDDYIEVVARGWSWQPGQVVQ